MSRHGKNELDFVRQLLANKCIRFTSNIFLYFIDSFSPDGRNCYSDGEANLTYLSHSNGYRYEMDNCIIDQAIRDIIWNCRCLPSFYPTSISWEKDKYSAILSYCTGEKLFCANKRIKSMGMEKIKNEDKISIREALESPDQVGNISKPAKMQCLPRCTGQEFLEKERPIVNKA